MSFSHQLQQVWNGGGPSISRSVTLTADGETNRSVSVSEGTSNVEVALAFAAADLKLISIIPTAGDVIVKTNSSSAPDDTFKIGSFLGWTDDCGLPNPFTADVVSLFLTNGNAANTTAIHAAVTDNGSPQTITTAITQPFGGTRRITATAGGTAGDVKAITVTINGTDENGDAQQEILPAFTVNTTGTVTGSLYFATVTSIVIPAHDGTGATTAIGVAAETSGDITVNIRSLHDSTP